MMTKSRWISPFLIVSLLLGLIRAANLEACSEVMLKTTGIGGKDAVSARTVDYPKVEKADLRWKTLPRGMIWQSTALGNLAGLCWQNPYGFVGLAFGGSQEDSANDPKTQAFILTG